MSTQQAAFASGDRVYNSNGRAALYVTEVAGRHVVQPLVETGDGDDEPLCEDVNGVALWPEVYRQPPRQKLDAEIADAQARLLALRSEVSTLAAQRREAQRGMEDVRARLKEHAALRYIDDFVAGRLPQLCAVFKYSGPSICSMAAALEYRENGREKGQKLLTLFGSAQGDLAWRINDYYDGSGQWTEIVPAATEEEAAAEIQRRYDLAVEHWRELPADTKRYSDAITWASCGLVKVPEDVAAYIAAAKRSGAETALAKAKADLATAQAAMAALDAPAAPAAA